MSLIVDFLEGRGPDSSGRSIEHVLGFDSATIERQHNFVQWVFPLLEASQAVPGSPVLTPADVDLIRQSETAQTNLSSAATMMAAFYGSSDHWLRSHDHNHLRITRIIKSLRLLAGDDAADRFYDVIEGLVDASGQALNDVSRRYWATA
ncbi:MAG: hypothetical protein EON87_11635 [Brevundimonas sp.]|nr:MAG: hypothetical protein EON87_11635 [Brevundimonas sp.]